MRLTGLPSWGLSLSCECWALLKAPCSHRRWWLLGDIPFFWNERRTVRRPLSQEAGTCQVGQTCGLLISLLVWEGFPIGQGVVSLHTVKSRVDLDCERLAVTSETAIGTSASDGFQRAQGAFLGQFLPAAS